MKQETIEEAAERIYPDCSNVLRKMAKETFINGAKWQQERMYSEEEVIDFLQEMNDWPTTFEGKIDIREWFEQFKKK